MQHCDKQNIKNIESLLRSDKMKELAINNGVTLSVNTIYHTTDYATTHLIVEPINPESNIANFMMDIKSSLVDKIGIPISYRYNSPTVRSLVISYNADSLSKIKGEQVKKRDEQGDFDSIAVKEGVAELFESNTELVNAVYEALVFDNYNVELKPYATDVWGNVPQQRGDNSFVAKEQYSIKLGEDKGIDIRLTIYFDDINKTAFVSNIENFENNRIHPLKKGLGLKGFLKANQLIINRGYTPVVDNLVSGYGYDMLSKLEKSGYLTKVLDKKVVNSQYDSIKYERRPFIFTNKIYKPEITPQQKQQAISLFSEFLDVYLQDYEQVEKILKEENIIQKKCN